MMYRHAYKLYGVCTQCSWFNIAMCHICLVSYCTYMDITRFNHLEYTEDNDCDYKASV